jgi:hypothetical protein
MNDTPNLTPKQWRFIEAYFRCGSIRGAARRCKFSERTCRSWWPLPAVQAVVDEANELRRGEVGAMIRGAAPKAVKTLIRMLKATRDGDKIKAADIILGRERTIVEREDILERLTALEAAAAGKLKRHGR